MSKEIINKQDNKFYTLSDVKKSKEIKKVNNGW